jgi:HAMP domain-containing protein
MAGTLYGFEGITLKKISGGNSEKDTPVPIPNTEVKLLSADDTWMATSRESRSLPEFFIIY